MTEAEWLAATDPIRLINACAPKSGQRKLRLIAAGSAQQVLHLMSCDHFRNAAAVASGWADGLVSNKAASEAARAVWEFIRDTAGTRAQPALAADSAAAKSLHTDVSVAARTSAWEAVRAVANSPLGAGTWEESLVKGRASILPVVRCVFGNPFRPVAVDPAWLTSTVVALAAGVYAERAFDRLPILADALQDAGCDHDDLLTHLRSPGPHVKGCWALDLILGKE